MKLQTQGVILLISLLELYCMAIVFLSVVGNNSNATGDVEVSPEVIPTPKSPRVDKIVLVIIDAMRYDFIPHLPFLNQSLAKGDDACIFKVSLSGPTVTLPRVKALVTGTTSSYWDFLANLKQTSGINSDNVITKAKSAGKKIVFYGDDTWLKLFPGEEFTRYEGVSSFFVTDFYEVDSNVTRNMEEELKTSDFDMMILHYLGVDHVGHVHGPRHALIPSKLQEMNKVIEEIYKSLERVPSELPHLILVTGDHGMANVGGHGGDSPPEVTTPLVLLSVSSKATKICQKPPSLWYDFPFPLKQLDIAAILSLLWDLPFPSKSRGLVPPEIISELEAELQITTLYKNAMHLAKFVTNIELTRKFEAFIHAYLESPRNRSDHLVPEFQEMLKELKSESVQSIEHDVGSLLSCIALLLVLLAAAFSPDSLNFFPYLATIGVSFLIPQVLTRCPSTVQLLLVFQVGFLCVNRGRFDGAKIGQNVIPLAVYLLFPILFFSSSFVEEEHFALYYLMSTITVVQLITDFEPQLLVLLLIHRLASTLNATGQKWNNDLDLNDYLQEFWKGPEVVTSIAFVLMILRVDRLVQKAAAVLIGLYKLSLFDLVLDPQYKHMEAKCCYLFLLLGCVFKRRASSNRKTWTHFWMLLSALLQRPENVILVAAVDIQVELISTSRIPTRLKALVLNTLCFCSFYYQGNSNHIATIDISLGYTGLSEYNEQIVAVLTFVSTFSLPLLVIISTLERTAAVVQDEMMGQLVMKTVLTNFIYAVVITAMRQHLFIWSVFVPKLLYLIMFTFFAVTVQVFVIGTEAVPQVIARFRKRNK